MENIFPQKRELSGDGKYWKKEADIAREKVKELEKRNKVLEDALRTIEVKGLERFNDYSNGKEVDFKSLCGAFIETVKKTLY